MRISRLFAIALPGLMIFSAHSWAAEGHAGLPQMDVSTFPSQLFWLAVNFLLLFLLMWRVALPRVASTLHKRAVALHDAMEAANAAREKARSLRDQSRALAFSATDDVKKLMDDLNRDIQTEQQKRNKELSDLLAQKQEAADVKIRELITAAEHAIPAQASEIAKAVIEKTTLLNPSQEQLRQAVHSLPEKAQIEWKGAA